MTTEQFRRYVQWYDRNADYIDNYGQRLKALERNSEITRLAASDPELGRIFDEHMAAGRTA